MTFFSSSYFLFLLRTVAVQPVQPVQPYGMNHAQFWAPFMEDLQSTQNIDLISWDIYRLIL